MNKSILIIEDSIAVRAILKARLARSTPECDVHLRSTIEGGLQEIRSGFHPNLVILDLCLGQQCAEETIQYIPSFFPAKVLLVTGGDAFEDQDFVKRCYAFGASDIFRKTIDESALPLMDRIIKLLDDSIPTVCSTK